jgi:hypothetical protein
VLLTGAAIATLQPSRAADHLDSQVLLGSGVGLDPAADITDVYAFAPSANRLALVMNVAPNIPLVTNNAPALSNKVDYYFRIRQYTGDGGPGSVAFGTTSLDVKCNADTSSPQKVTCTAPGGISGSFTMGGSAGTCTTEDICVFAGPRSDPFFFDLAAFKATVDAGSPKFNPDGGVNFFNKANVLSIVVELNATKAFGDAGAPIVAVAGETVRNP